MTISTNTSIFLLIITTVSWSTYIAFKKKLAPNVPAMVFTVIYACGQLSFAIIWWISSGSILPTTSVSSKKAGLIACAGIFVMFAEYLYFFTVPFVRYSVFTAIATSGYFISIPVTYFIDPNSISAPFLLGSLTLNCCGLFCLVYSEYIMETTGYTSLTDSYQNNSNNTDSEESKLMCIKEEEELEEEGLEVHANDIANVSFEYWVGILYIGVILMTSWSVLPAYAYTGSNAITDPSLIFILFSIGYFFSLPIIISVFHYLIHIGGQKSPSFLEIIQLAKKLPSWELFMCFLVSLYSAVGYMCYFYVVMDSDVPTSVAVSFMMCQTPASIIVSFIAQDEKYTNSNSKVLLFFGFCFYAAGSAVLFKWAFE